MSLDPQIAALLDTLDAGFPPVHTMTGAQARAAIRARFVPAAEPESCGEVSNQVVPGPGGAIPVRIYRPDGDNLPVLIAFMRWLFRWPTGWPQRTRGPRRPKTSTP